MSNKDQTNIFNLKQFLQSKQGKYSLISVLVLGVLLISGLFTSNLLKDQSLASAALNCPANFTAVGNSCQYNATANTAYTCPNGGTVSGSNCIYNAVQGSGSYSCPSGGALNGTQCSYNASASVNASCPSGVYDSSLDLCTITTQAPVNSQYFSDPCVRYPGGDTWNVSSYVSGILISAFSRPLVCGRSPVPTNATWTCPGGIFYSTYNNGQLSNVCIDRNEYSSTSGIDISFLSCGPNWTTVSKTTTFNDATMICARQAQATPTSSLIYSCPSGGSAVGTVCYYNATLGAGTYSCPLGGTLSGTSCSYSANLSVTGYTCPSGGSLSGTVCIATSGVTYTPNSGQITGLTCTPTSATVGTTVNCSGQGTGAPSGVPYAGSVTVTIDNGGGSITTTFNPDGTFTASSVPVGNTTGSKTATTNLGGTTPVTVVAGNTVVDPDLASGPGSLSNSTDCTASTNVVIGTTYTCTFPINGTGPFVLPSGGIQARTNQTTNNSSPVPTCTISGSILTCTGITTVGTPNPLTAGTGNVQLGKGTTPATWNNKGVVNLTTSATLCSTTDPCALFDTALTYSPTQALAKRYGGSGSTTADNLILTLKDTRLEQPTYTTTCTFRYKFKSDTTWRNLASTVAYNNTTGCSSTLLKADQLFWNVDFEITAVTTSGSTTKNYLLYSNYDFKAGSIGVTSIGGSGL